MQGSFLWKFLVKISSLSPAKSKTNGLAGFTLIELLVVIVIAGVLAAIAAPAFLGFTNKQRLNSSTSSVFTALKGAQSQAKKDSRPRMVTFDTATNKIINEQGQPIPLESGVKIESITYNGAVLSGTCANINSLLFDSKGTPFKVTPPTSAPCTPDLTLARQAADIPVQIKLKHDLIGQKQCVTIRTLLGALATGDCS